MKPVTMFKFLKGPNGQFRFLVRFIPIVFLSIVTPSCTLQRSYWVNRDAQDVLSNDSLIHKPSDHHSGRYYHDLRVIEYDEQGDRWERQQVIEAVNTINSSPAGTPVIVYVHGWRHNAKPGADNNLLDFSNYLKNYRESSHSPIGIYVGWRGASVFEDGPMKIPSAVPMAISILDRMEVADRVASITLANDLWTLRRAANVRNRPVILVGHSLGGRILERTVSHSLLTYHSQRNAYRTLSDPESFASAPVNNPRKRELLIADLVVLVNPANESLVTRQLKLALNSWPINEPPAIVSISSDTDSAVSGLFPIGAAANRALSPLTAFPGRRYRIGHLDPKVDDRTETQWSYRSQATGFDERQIGTRARFIDSTGSFDFYETDLENWNLRNYGYLVVRVGDDILHGHGGYPEEGLFCKSLSKFIAYLVRSTLDSANYTTSPLFKELHP